MKDEAELLAAISRGDESALEVLYDAYAPRLGRLFARLTLERATAAELLNDVFLVIWQKADSFRGDSRVSTWIFAIAYRMGLKALRSRKSSQSLDTAPPVDSGIQVLDWRRDLDRALAKLSPEQRATTELTYYFGYSYREIAEQLGCPENTVKTRMHYARRKLRALLNVDTYEY